ncbi:S41 family peptidase [Pseudobacter ginsenosidimutans]|uniref:S41 family peptidase n=1 Tax=Pseudobacter ginsenosidimutans TaxID=661488 RepID=UPI00131546FC|nr:S41 family peptidase [Pseudobacter ginsenosidimutans]
MLSVEDMKTDLAFLWTALQEMHPGFGIYISGDSLLAKYEDAGSSLREPGTEDDFILHAYPFLSALGCGHTQLLHSLNYQQAPQQTASLPFDVLVNKQNAWVTNSRIKELTTGDEIISVNDIPVPAIIEAGSSLYCGDGYVSTFKELFLSEYGGFSDACVKHFHLKPPFRVVISTSGGITKTISAGAPDTSLAEKKNDPEKYAGWDRSETSEGTGFYIHKNNRIALLEVRQLVYGDTLVYEKCFEEISKKNIGKLILDMRHNGGGDLRITIKLLSYLMNDDFGMIKDLYSRIPDPSSSGFASSFDSGLSRNFDRICIPARKAGDEYHKNASPEFGQVFSPIAAAKTNRFNGKLIVLIDGATFSSAALFVAALKAQRNNVQFLGSETAGTEEGCNGFAMQILTLPNTGIRVQFPLLRVESMAKAPVHGRGLIPDHPVIYTPADIVQGNDPVLKKAMNLIK